MKKVASILVVLGILLSMSVQAVFAAQQGTLELIEARNDRGGGVIFIFRFSPNDFTRSNFKDGRVYFEDSSLKLNCNITDETEGVLQCTTSRAAAGKNVRINLAGFYFNASVPLRNGSGGGSANSETCYNVYDLFENPQGASWEAFDVHCPGSSPSVGDTLPDFPDPWGGNRDYDFRDESPSGCFGAVTEDAYYAQCGF